MSQWWCIWCPMIRMGVFLLVPAYPSSPGPKAVKRLCVCVVLHLSFCKLFCESSPPVSCCSDVPATHTRSHWQLTFKQEALLRWTAWHTVSQLWNNCKNKSYHKSTTNQRMGYSWPKYSKQPWLIRQQARPWRVLLITSSTCRGKIF